MTGRSIMRFMHSTYRPFIKISFVTCDFTLTVSTALSSCYIYRPFPGKMLENVELKACVSH
jgi:hypothetical protein